MPSYLVTIRTEATNYSAALMEAAELGPVVSVVNDEDRATVRIRYEHHDGGALIVSVKDGPEAYPEDAPSTESVAAARALAPAVVEELRQMMRNEAKAVVRDFVAKDALRLGTGGLLSR